MTSASGQAPAPLSDIVDLVLRLGILLLRSGTTTFRVRQRMRDLAHTLGLERLDAQISLNGIAVTARAGDKIHTAVADNLTLGINAQRLAALENIALSMTRNTSIATLHAELDRIERTPPLYSVIVTALAVGIACGAFAYFNGGSLAEMGIAAASAAFGQAVRTFLLRRHINQLVVTALCAFATGGLYGLIAQGIIYQTGMPIGYQSGFISAVLYLIPGFPLVASVIDMIQLEFAAAPSRVAYGMMLLLAGAVGVTAIASIVGLPSEAPAPVAWPAGRTILLRIACSFIGGLGFAILYNSLIREVVAVGVLTVVGNLVRLELHDFGVSLALASFIGALLVGLLATLIAPRLRLPRITLTVPGVILMTPGALCYDAVVLFGRGDVLGALTDAVQAGFVVGAMAMGLALARIATERQWAFEN